LPAFFYRSKVGKTRTLLVSLFNYNTVIMKKLFIIPCFLLIAPTCLYAQPGERIASGNPILKGWYADPEAAVFEKQYWIYPTYSAPYDQQVFLDAFSSADLVNWTRHNRIMDTSNVKWAKRAVWAPAIIEKDSRYFLFFAANDIQNDNEYGGIGVAVADSPQGPFKDWLGRPLIDKFQNGAQPIDQFIFKDQDGKYYIIYGGWGHCNIARLKDDFTGFIAFEDGTVFREITPDNYVEGPTMFMRNDKYYFMWSEGGWGGPDYSVAYAVADSPFGPFKRVGKILQQNKAVATGAGHHSVIHTPTGDSSYIVYHRRPLGETDANHRVVCIDRMYFDESGLIRPVKITFEGVYSQQLK
jgi:beta-xylosidase